MEFSDVIKTRKSVRKFSEQAVEDEKIERILECARLAPSWANKQCWHFVVIRDLEAIKTIATSGVMVNKWLRKAPAIIVACGDPNLSGRYNEMDYFLVDVAIAMEHLVLAATNLGLGTCWIGAFDEAKIKGRLGIPDGILVVALTPVGYPAKRKSIKEEMTKMIVQSKKRKPLAEIVHYDRW